MNLKEKKYLLLDLDGVCYGKHNNYSLEKVFGQVSQRMTKFISERLGIDIDAAKKLQTNYFYKYNTSLNGLMIHHNIPPEEFLKYVHTIDLSFMKEDKIMRNELEKLDMEKFIFTNGSAEHAENILTHLGIYDLFGRNKVFDIKDAGYIPKPEAKTFDLMVKKFGINPKETIYIEDIAKNLSIGYERGCTTVWLINDEHFGKIDSDKEYISHKIENLSLFLKEIRILKSQEIMSLEKIINDAWEIKEQVNQNSDQKLKDTINQVISDLDSGKSRVAEKIDGKWVTHQHLKKAIMLSFRIYPMENLNGPYSSWFDKAHLLKGKTAGWSKEDHEKAGFRMVPNSPVRKGSFVGKNAVLMPCYVNIGAYIDEGTMIDTFARAGSCCQIGKNCHISAGSGVGGVLEPAQALPTIIEDNVFLGAMSEVVEGVIVGEGSVLSMGMYIGQSTKIVDRKTGKITYGKIPPYSVVVPGSLPDKSNSSAPSLYCAVIIKQVDEKTRSKTSINDLLRD